MNIFFLDKCPKKSAEMQCNKHIVKMPLESTQMLSSVWHRYGHGDKVQYKQAYKNHPATVWAGDSIGNYVWLWQHALELCFEYTRRYNKIHKCQQIVLDLEYRNIKFAFASSVKTDHPQCMPEEYKHNNSVKAYRNYYIGEKSKIAKWNTLAQVPYWFKNKKLHI